MKSRQAGMGWKEISFGTQTTASRFVKPQARRRRERKTRRLRGPKRLKRLRRNRTCRQSRERETRAKPAEPLMSDLPADRVTSSGVFNTVQTDFAGAPSFGGLFESAVKSAKSLLSRIIGEQRLTYEELSTVFARIEAVLNSRPLCPLSHDSNEFEVLTPAHLLIGKSLLAVPEYDWDETPMSRLSRFQIVQAISQHFWRKWNNLYLHQLQMRNKWFSDANPLKVGDLVLIKEDNLPSLKWRRGRIEEMLPGKDGVVRVVILRTQSGKITRPVVKICRLPIDT
ncbi:hypothetical protein EVAR_23772_1 [Eumeta japonica]|uniref:DUF5641 domain-containing protein n=1 Tax=Eumeta variegata TaxID=151549 RepID=A0A4C1VHA4_EUMVA|nr:hypothetical protein EVAR_23772_1 [Eumeta japonica]